MRPSVDVVATAFLAQLDRAFTHASSDTERMTLFGTQRILQVLLHELDGAAVRLDQIRELRSLLRRSAPLCPPGLAACLMLAAEKADSAESDIRRGALERILDELLVAFIELQTWLETSNHTQAPALLTQCWDFLARADAQRIVLKAPW